DDLGVNVLCRAVYVETRTLGGAADLCAYALVALQTRLVGILLRNHLNSPLLSLLLLRAGLAFLAADVLVGVTDALALVGFRRTLLADFRSKLADLLLVRTGDDDRVRIRNVDRDAVGLGHRNLMRVAEVHNQILALLGNTVTNTLYAQLLLEAFGNANNHVIDQAAGQAVQCTVVLLVVRT